MDPEEEIDIAFMLCTYACIPLNKHFEHVSLDPSDPSLLNVTTNIQPESVPLLASSLSRSDADYSASIIQTVLLHLATVSPRKGYM